MSSAQGLSDVSGAGKRRPTWKREEEVKQLATMSSRRRDAQ
jgi:hypothetical protein